MTLTPELIERGRTLFYERISLDTETGCWLWIGNVNPVTGYGSHNYSGLRFYAHRFSVECIKGEEIPEGLQVDHLCRVERCVNPDHLEVVTRSENTLRSPIHSYHAQQAKTHCPQGHPYDEANTYRDRYGRRSCRTCSVQATREWRARKRSGAS